MSVRNMSSTPITEAQEHLLVHGPNFAVFLKCLHCHSRTGLSALQAGGVRRIVSWSEGCSEKRHTPPICCISKKNKKQWKSWEMITPWWSWPQTRVVHGDDGQRWIYKEGRKVTISTYIQDHPCWSHNKTEEQTDNPAAKHQSRRWG